MSKIFVSDDEISNLIDFISNNNANEILQKINSFINAFPADERIYFLRHSLKSSSGDLLGALADIWLCMNINPQQNIFLEAVSKTGNGCWDTKNSFLNKYADKVNGAQYCQVCYKNVYKYIIIYSSLI